MHPTVDGILSEPFELPIRARWSLEELYDDVDDVDVDDVADGRGWGAVSATLEAASVSDEASAKLRRTTTKRTMRRRRGGDDPALRFANDENPARTGRA